METLDAEVPLARRLTNVALLYNLKKGLDGRTPDAEAEYDSIDTVHAIERELEAIGLNVTLIEADRSLPERLKLCRAEIAFNIAEGLAGRGREAQIPALLNMLGMPFTGSDETALAVALDKALCKRLAAAYRVRTPRFRVVGAGGKARGLRFPVIVKPNAEGSSKGVSEACVVGDGRALDELIGKNLELYGGEMLAEEYVPGREFTVGLIGNGANLHVFEPMEIVYSRPTQGDYHVYSYKVKQEYAKYVRYDCPADITPEQSQEMKDMARRVFRMLGCRDLSRVDFRLDEAGKPWFIEINPLPGLAPGYSDYPMLTQFQGVAYGDLIRRILSAAAARYGFQCGWEGNGNDHL